MPPDEVEVELELDESDDELFVELDPESDPEVVAPDDPLAPSLELLLSATPSAFAALPRP